MDERTSHRRLPPGFTLVELLAVLFVIGVLVALVLPAVQAARASARRVTCVNQMKQIGLALNAYQSVSRYFPSVCYGSQVDPKSHSLLGGHMVSPLVQLLPELDQAPLFHATNLDEPGTATSRSLSDNRTVMTTTVGLFLCPADSAHSPPGYGRCNYRFSIGPTAWEGNSIAQPETWAGAFAVLHSFRPADFRDGLAQTIGASERIQGSWVNNALGPGDYLLTSIGAGRRGPLPGPDWAVVACTDVPVASPTETRSGESWFVSGLHFTRYNHCTAPNPKRIDCGFYLFLGDQGIGWRAIQNGVFAARSFHSGGVNVLLMDGAVQFTTDSVNPALWRALSTRSGGEVVSSVGD